MSSKLVFCPDCGNRKITYLYSQNKWYCATCEKHFENNHVQKVSEIYEYKENLRNLPTLLKQKQINIEEFNVLKADYKEKIEEAEKEFKKPYEITSNVTSSSEETPIIPKSIEYIPPPRDAKETVIKVEQKQSSGLGTCALVCFIIFIITLAIMAILGISAIDFINSLFGR